LKKAILIIRIAALADAAMAPSDTNFNDNQALNYFKPDITL